MNDIYIHYGSTEFVKNKFRPVENIPYLNKPSGGLWASPMDSDYGWVHWNKDNDFHQYDDNDFFIFRLSDSVRILNIKNEQDVNFVLSTYPRKQSEITKIIGDIFADYEKIKNDYDAISFEENRFTHRPFYGWDCDTLLVLNPDVIVPQDKSIIQESVLPDWDYKTASVSDENPKDAIDITKTGMPKYDDLLPSSPEAKYMADVKNLKGDIVMMSPEEYYSECAKKIFPSSSVYSLKRSRGMVDKEEISELIDVIVIKKKKFPIPFINYAEQGQEGLHRMFALGQLFGWDEKFPVLVVNWVDEERHKKDEKEKEDRIIYNGLKDAVEKALIFEYRDKSEFEAEIDWEIQKELKDDDNAPDIDFVIDYTDDYVTVSVHDVNYEFDADLLKINPDKKDIDLDDLDYSDLDDDPEYQAILNDKAWKNI